MLDQNYFRNNLQEVAARLAKRGYTLDIDTISNLRQTQSIANTNAGIAK